MFRGLLDTKIIINDCWLQFSTSQLIIILLVCCLDNQMCQQPHGKSKNASTMTVLLHDLIIQLLDLIIVVHL